MKILHLADLHYRLDWMQWATEHAAGYDLVVVAGDLLDGWHPSIGLHDQCRTVGAWLRGLRVPTVVCTGNHDLWTARDELANGGWLKRLRGVPVAGVDGDLVNYQGLRIYVNGWTQLPPEGHYDIVVTHSPPEGCPCSGSGGRYGGDPEIWEPIQVRPPRLLLCGHVHHADRLACKWSPIDPVCTVLLPGCDMRLKTPACWSIDTQRGEAVHSTGLTLSA